MFTPAHFEATKTEISKAKTPEEAARIFGKMASIAIGQAVANALQQTVSAMSTNLAATASIQGWESYVTGLNLRCDWPSPNLSSTSIMPPALCTPNLPPDGAKLAGGVSISVGITGSF